jgi:putative heme-binding domain-containing protein
MRFGLAVLACLSGQDGSRPGTLEGFRVEELYAAPREEGSWICMAFDPERRILVSAESGPIRRVTLAGGGTSVRVEPVEPRVVRAMGLLHAFGALYVNGDGPKGTGFYRLRDRDGRFEEPELLKAWSGGMVDHGPHAIVRGPDDHLYVMNGNYVVDPSGFSPRSPYRNYAEDLLLPRLMDSVGHAIDYARLRAPGGHVFRTDPDGKTWELLMGGFRNPYDLAFDARGELFTFDSDMDWDQGLPWYRPNRINHAVPGGEYGWRTGSGKWPVQYPDSLPSTVDVGLASPTGVSFGTRSAFPAKYRRALFAADWAYGRILAVHLAPRGASFTGTFEEFVKGKPLQVTDLEFGPDGAMYFITGGRGTQSKLYRVTYRGRGRPGDDAPEPADEEAARARALRRRLEALQTAELPGAVDELWPHLGSSDRWIRFAARVALERQAPEGWRERALGERAPATSLSALLALVRSGGAAPRARVLEALGRQDWATLTEEQRHELIRIYALAFIRLGKPAPDEAEPLVARLEPLYPSGVASVDRELGGLLVYLGAPGFVEKALRLLGSARTPEDEIHLALLLRLARKGWTLELRREYLRWFERASRFRGGTSVPAFVRSILSEALVTLTDGERLRLEPEIRALTERPAKTVKDPGLIVRAWTVAELLPSVEKLERRSFRKGEAAFDRASCRACHRFRGEGGSAGPDLTAVSSRFTRRDLLEAVVEPSKVVSDQYQNTLFQTVSGDVIVGRVVKEEAGRLHVRTDPIEETGVVLEKASIRATKPSPLSPMPEGLLNILERDSVLDLIAYLESGGDPGHALFRR